VLFADLKGSMELLADRDPEEARRLLDPLLEQMMEAVHRYEGTVNQVMGDGIMALFGAPLAHEDHAVRACYAALRMQENVTRYGDDLQRSQGVPVQIRVGLNSGEVVVRSIASDLRMDYTAVGQTTHLAARMEQMAKPGSVLITASTLRLAEGYVEVRTLGPVRVKGLAEPVEVFEVAGAGVVRTRLQAASARGLTRFVGRQAELEALRQALELARGGRGQVVAVVGEPGVGKSRLFYEFTRSHRARGWLLLEATSASYGKASPYLPAIGLLRTYFQVEDGDDPRRIRERVTGKVLTLDPGLHATLPAFLALFDVPVEDAAWQALDPAQRGLRTADACKRLLLRESQVQPLCLVFEDLHWIDSETQALLDGLVESLPSAPLLLLVNYRPEYQHGWGNRSYYTQLRVDPLPPESAGELLRTLLGGDPSVEPLQPFLIQRTEGNPFFLEESVRALVETGVLDGERGGRRLVRPLSAIQVPATVQAILAARIDRLGPDAKRLLQSASVIGKDIPLALLQAVVELPERELHEGLRHLQAAEFLYEASLFPEPEYTFKHALTHEVAYQSLLQERRRALHARAVEAFERLHPERVAERIHWLAHHAFRGEVWGKALTYLRETVVSAPQASLDAALGGAESSGHFWWIGEHERAVRVGQRELAIATDFRDFGHAVVSNFRLGQAYHALGDYPQAMECLGRNVQSLDGELQRERFGMAGLPSVFSRSWLAWCLAEQGEFAVGLARAEEAVQIAHAVDHPYSLVVACFGVGALHLVRGEFEQAIPVLERALVLAQMVEPPIVDPLVAAPLGYAYALTGRVAEGIRLLEQATDRAAQLKLAADESLRLGWLAEARLLGGGAGSARPLAERARGLAETRRERARRAYALRLLGEIASRGEPQAVEEAEAAYRESLALARELGMRPLSTRCELALGTLARGLGRTEAARTELAAAVEAFRSMGMTRWLGEAEAELGALQ